MSSGGTTGIKNTNIKLKCNECELPRVNMFNSKIKCFVKFVPASVKKIFRGFLTNLFKLTRLITELWSYILTTSSDCLNMSLLRKPSYDTNSIF